VSKAKVLAGTTSYIADIFIQDTSSTTGAGLTGLNNASAGLTAFYTRKGQATWTAISLTAGTVGTWSSGGFKETDATDAPGFYELGVPNAVLATGAVGAVISLRGATNMAPTGLEFELDAINYQDSVRHGATALPNVAAGAAGGLPLGNASGQVTSDLTQAVPTTNTAHTIGDALNAARAQGFGKWTLVGTTLTLYASDGTTAVRTFTLDNALTPTSRT
jgi:hypothetical protein